MSIDLSKCDEKIIKIGENNVELQYILYTISSEEVICQIESYGQNRIDEELIIETEELDRINTFNKTTEAATQQLKIDKLDSIQTEMDKILEPEVIEK